MLTGSGDSKSIWAETARVPSYDALRENTSCDVCVIGAGIAGMMTAYELTKAGKTVIVLDDGGIGSGETGRTTAHITAALDDRYYNIETLHGEEGARLAAESHTAAINRAEEICRLENIDCDFLRVDGYLFLAEKDTIEKLEREQQACERAGLADVQIMTHAPLDFWNTGSCLKFPRQGQFHPLKFLAGLARVIAAEGVRIHCGSHVKEVEDKIPCTVTTTDGYTVSCKSVVVATNASVTDYVVTHAKQAPYRTYVIGARIPKNSVPPMLLWDTPDPYHYVRIQPEANYDVLIVGGEDHKTGHKDDMDDRFVALELWTNERFPMVEEVIYRWSGQVLEPFDYLSWTGVTPGGENVYMHSGDSGNGITHGIMAGILLTDMIMRRDNPWSKLYDPSRITLGVDSIMEFTKENADVAWQFTDYLKPGEKLEGIEPGEGRVILRDGKRVAVYRDQDGVLHERSAVCTHLKCIVAWNSLEKSWDCPCHGSRFDPYGNVMNGPAIMGLEEV